MNRRRETDIKRILLWDTEIITTHATRKTIRIQYSSHHVVERAHIVASLIPEYRWSDKRPEPDLRVISVIVCEEINKTIKLADSDYFPPQTLLSLPRHYPIVRTVSFRPLFTSLSFSCPLLFHPLPLKWNGGPSLCLLECGGVWRARQFAFLNVREPVYVTGRRKKEKEGYTAPNLDLLLCLSLFLSRRLLFIYSISSFVYSTARPLSNPG